ncbi:MAG: serine protein kinase PrkA, partial [Thermodesulfobacteriota bacterium]
MENIEKAMRHLKKSAGEVEQRIPIPFEMFLRELTFNPATAIRNVFQVFHDMVKTYVDQEADEYPDDPESIGYVFYDCNRLLVEGANHPFFADRLFADRLMKHVEAMRHGAQQNKIYIIDGPPGCGKSTFLNNLLKKFEEYANTKKGLRYEILWRLDRKALGGMREYRSSPLIERLSQLLEHSGRVSDEPKEDLGLESEDQDQELTLEEDEYVEV